MPFRIRVGSRPVAWFVALLLLVGPAAAQESVTGPRLLRLADYYDFVGIDEVAVAPDASRVVFVRADINAEQDTSETSIWSVGPEGADLHRLIVAGTSPRFAPDGSALAYLHARQVWLLPFGGGEPWQLTGLPGGVSSFEWAPDSRRLVLVGQEGVEAPTSILPEDQRADFEDEPQAAEPVEVAPLDAGEWIPAEPAEPLRRAAETTVSPTVTRPLTLRVISRPATPGCIRCGP